MNTRFHPPYPFKDPCNLISNLILTFSQTSNPIPQPIQPTYFTHFYFLKGRQHFLSSYHPIFNLSSNFHVYSQELPDLHATSPPLKSQIYLPPRSYLFSNSSNPVVFLPNLIHSLPKHSLL